MLGAFAGRRAGLCTPLLEVRMPVVKSSEIRQRLDRFVKGEMKRTGVPGAAVGILHRGRRLVEGYGVTSVEHPLPVEADTLFQIGSTTKTYTATAAMRLVEQGKLDLNAPVRRYLPDLRLKNKEAERKTRLPRWSVDWPRSSISPRSAKFGPTTMQASISPDV
jgi:CubicO group peptidase (beta-lactamase class C family)